MLKTLFPTLKDILEDMISIWGNTAIGSGPGTYWKQTRRISNGLWKAQSPERYLFILYLWNHSTCKALYIQTSTLDDSVAAIPSQGGELGCRQCPNWAAQECSISSGCRGDQSNLHLPYRPWVIWYSSGRTDAWAAAIQHGYVYNVLDHYNLLGPVLCSRVPRAARKPLLNYQAVVLAVAKWLSHSCIQRLQVVKTLKNMTCCSYYAGTFTIHGQHIEVYTSPRGSSFSHVSVVGSDFIKVIGAKIEYDFFNNRILLQRQADPFLSLST